jgi:hypothetical protein
LLLNNPLLALKFRWKIQELQEKKGELGSNGDFEVGKKLFKKSRIIFLRGIR